MATQAPALDDSILILNEELKDIVSKTIPQDVNIRFDFPDDIHPSKPTIVIFLYDIQENLELRTGLSLSFDQRKDDLESTNHPTSVLDFTLTNVTCKYLFTFLQPKYSSDSTETFTGPRNQEIVAMNAVLNAIFNHRGLTQVEIAHSKIVPPMDIQSLGTLWQALESKPRLCLGYELTIPIKIPISTKSPIIRNVSTNLHSNMQI